MKWLSCKLTYKLVTIVIFSSKFTPVSLPTFHISETLVRAETQTRGQTPGTSVLCSHSYSCQYTLASDIDASYTRSSQYTPIIHSRWVMSRELWACCCRHPLSSTIHLRPVTSAILLSTSTTFHFSPSYTKHTTSETYSTNSNTRSAIMPICAICDKFLPPHHFNGVQCDNHTNEVCHRCNDENIREQLITKNARNNKCAQCSKILWTGDIRQLSSPATRKQ